jgi:hypothetical protein
VIDEKIEFINDDIKTVHKRKINVERRNEIVYSFICRDTDLTQVRKGYF